MGGKTKGLLLRILSINVNVSPKYNYLQLQVKDSTSQMRYVLEILRRHDIRFQGKFMSYKISRILKAMTLIYKFFQPSETCP
jgi:hypothetical protein